MFGAWGIVVFGLVVGLAIYIVAVRSFRPLLCFVLGVGLIWLLWPAVSSERRPGRLEMNSIAGNDLRTVGAAGGRSREAKARRRGKRAH